MNEGSVVQGFGYFPGLVRWLKTNCGCEYSVAADCFEINDVEVAASRAAGAVLNRDMSCPAPNAGLPLLYVKKSILLVSCGSNAEKDEQGPRTESSVARAPLKRFVEQARLRRRGNFQHRRP